MSWFHRKPPLREPPAEGDVDKMVALAERLRAVGYRGMAMAPGTVDRILASSPDYQYMTELVELAAELAGEPDDPPDTPGMCW